MPQQQYQYQYTVASRAENPGRILRMDGGDANTGSDLVAEPAAAATIKVGLTSNLLRFLSFAAV